MHLSVCVCVCVDSAAGTRAIRVSLQYEGTPLHRAEQMKRTKNQGPVDARLVALKRSGGGTNEQLPQESHAQALFERRMGQRARTRPTTKRNQRKPALLLTLQHTEREPQQTAEQKKT